MNNPAKIKQILFVIEGEKAEKNFIESITKAYNLSNFKIFIFATNIFSIYSFIKNDPYSEYLNLRTILKTIANRNLEKLNEENAQDIDKKTKIEEELSKTNNAYQKQAFAFKIQKITKRIELRMKQISIIKKQLEDIDNKFDSTYLIFDLELQNSIKKDSNGNYDDADIDKNLEIIKIMLQKCNDETDPDIGKLLINYPMIESYRDCNDFFDNCYWNNEIEINKLIEYKNIVYQKHPKHIPIGKYIKENFDKLLCMNLYKLNYLMNNNKWDKLTLNDFLEIQPIDILEKITQIIKKRRTISILNTSLFFLLYYYGNRNNFFDNIITNC